MRKVALLLVAMMFLFSLNAQQSVRSNSIGQDRGRFAEESEYSLLREGNTSTLYHEGEVVWVRTFVPYEDGYEVSTFHVDDGSTHLSEYQRNRLVSETIGEESRYFTYGNDGLLEKSVLLVSDKLTEMEIYSYDGSTRRLNSILTITAEGSSILYFGDPIGRPWFSYTKGDTFTKVTQISQDLQIQQVWEGENLIKSVEIEKTEEGGIRLTTTEKGVAKSELYDERGLLVKRISPSLTTEYRYTEDRTLLESRGKGKDGSVRIIRFEEGQEVSESLYQAEILQKETRYPKDGGKVETLFDNGKPYCDITYALDGVRVLSIRYR